MNNIAACRWLPLRHLLSIQSSRLFSSNKKNNLNNPTDPRDFSGLQGIVTQRRHQGQVLRKQSQGKQFLQKLDEHYANNQIEFTLYMRHDCQRSQLIFALMNYNKLGFKKISNVAFLDALTYAHKEELRNRPDDQRWPLLKVQNSIYPMTLLRGEDSIVQWMTQNNFFEKVTRNEEWVGPACEFIKKQIKEPLDVVFWHPVLTTQNTFDADPESYRKGGRSYILLAVLRMNLQKILSRSVKGIYQILTQRQTYSQAKEKLVNGINEWLKLLTGNDFCGGNEPDAADFYVQDESTQLYSIIRSRINSRHFQKFLENKLPRQFLSWYRRMDSCCQFDRQRLTIL